ncbi:MAG: twin-arginine translocation signal domain-containing protein [Candidatus Sumerlaeia bacterium]|nr:twin-arginine translocation signal domain-containing protein [Candidatus Sumerlaeia bacterium]
MTVSRRQFIGHTAALGALGLSGAQGAGAPESKIPGPRFPDSKIRIQKVFMAKPVPSWPTPKLVVEDEIKRLNGIIAGFQNELSDIEFAPQDILLRTPDQTADLAGRIGKVDAILAFNLTSTVGALVRAVAQVGLPTYLYSQPYSGHDWSGVAALQKEGLKIECLATSDYHEIVDAMRPVRAMRRMRESRLVYLNTNPYNPKNAEKIKAALGTEIVSTDPKRFNALFARCDENLAQQVVRRWKRNARKTVEPSDQDLLDSAKFYLTMRQILAEERAQGITINCLGLFTNKQLPAYPCLGFCELNNELFVGGCEGDMDSALTMLLFGYMVGKPGFISDPVIDTSKNILIHAHCVAPTKMDGPQGKPAPHIIRSHLEDDKGAVLQVKMRVGQTITMAKLVGCETMLISTGKITDTPEVERGCRTKITTQVADARKILEGYAHGLHRVIFYGDHVRDVKRLSRFLPMTVVEEC